MVLNIAAGQVAVPVGLLQSVLCTSTAVETVTLDPAPPSGTNRIDLVVCTARSADWGGANEDFVFAKVNGAQASSPVAPAVPAQSVALAQVYVAGGSAAVTAANITDRRTGGLNMPPVAVPAGRLYATVQTVAASGAEQPVGLAGTNYLYGGMARVTPSGTRDCLVIPVTGVYLVTCSVGWQLSMAGIPPSQQIFTELWRNNAEARRWFGATNWTALPVVGGCDALSLLAGDLLDVRGFQSTGANAGTYPDSGRTYLTATLMSTGP
jgi:hypothetical protein